MVTTTRSPGSNVPLPHQLTNLDTARLRAYRENLGFYEGRQWAEPQRRRERRLTFNYARTIIENTASYTMSGLASVVDPADGSPEGAERARRAQAALRETAEANALDQLDFDNEIDCSILGDAAYKVTWDAAEGRVRISAPDVQGLFAWTMADDPLRVWRVATGMTCSRRRRPRCSGPYPQSANGKGGPHSRRGLDSGRVRVMAGRRAR